MLISRLFQRAKRRIHNAIKTLPWLKTACIIILLVIALANAYYKPNEVDLRVDNDATNYNPTKQDLEHDSYEQTSSTENTNRPHIILMVADDLGFNDVSYHGSEINTPNIDWLAKSGVRLENYYVQPVCTPTRSQLLSGRYQIHTGLQHGIIWPSDPWGLPLDSPTLADKLREAGYATHMVGKWHLGFYKKEYTPTYRGFDSFFGFLGGHEDYFTHRAGYKHWHGYDLRENEEPADVQRYNGSYSTHLFTEKVINVLKQHNKNKPLFLYIPFQAPHSPPQVPESYIKPYDRKIQGLTRRIYAGLVSCMDEAVGNITKALKENGFSDNSLLIFTTDNGSNEKYGGSNRPLRGHKSQFFEGGIRAVGLMYSKWLQRNMAGTVSKELIHVTDWFPTLVNLAKGNLSGTKPLDGYDQWDTITKGVPNQRREFLINIDPLTSFGRQPLFNNTFDTRIKAALRMGDWKLMTGYEANGPRRSSSWYKTYSKGAEYLWLFNIKSDPNENIELSDRYPQIVKVMLDRLAQYHKTSVPAIKKPTDANADPALHNGFWGPWL